MSRLVNDTQVINDMFGQGLMRILSMSLTLVGIIISMISLNWRLALASFAVLPLFWLPPITFRAACALPFARRARPSAR